MLKQLRRGDPLAWVVLALPPLAFRIAGFWQPLPSDSIKTGGPLYKLFMQMGAATMWGSALWALLAAASIAALVTHLFNNYQFAERNSFLAGLLTLTLLWSWPGNYLLHPVLCATVFQLLALRRLVNMYRQPSVNPQLYDAGFFLACSVLCYWPSAPTVLLLWLALGVMRPFSLREWLLPVLGLATPTILLAAGYRLLKNTLKIPGIAYRRPLNLVIDDPSLWIFFAVNVVVYLIALATYFRGMQATTVQRKNVRIVVLIAFALWIATALNAVLADGHLRHGALLSAAVGIPLALFALADKRQLIRTVILVVWLASLILYRFSA